MSAAATPLTFHPAEVPEDQARAGYYALLARLFYAAPDARLLEAIADETLSGTEQSALTGAWSALASAARATDAEAARIEYEQLFVGVGKAEVTPYATFYLADTGREKILAGLREELGCLGLRRAERALEPEDHVAALLDTMRYLISAGSEDAALQKQREFFDRYIAGSYRALCEAISASGKSAFYRHVARFAEAFLLVEHEAFKVF